MTYRIKELAYVHVQHPVHLPFLQHRLPCLQCMMCTTSGTKPIAESMKVHFIDAIENFHYHALHYFVFCAGYAQWSFPSIRLLYPYPPDWFRSILPFLQSLVQACKVLLQFLAVGFFRHPIHPRCCLAVKRTVRSPQRFHCDMMRKAGELFLLIGLRPLLHPLKFRADGYPSLCMVHLSLQRVPCSALPFAPTTRAFLHPSQLSSLL